jgi:transcriptional regulator with XRE-family HTH domain
MAPRTAEQEMYLTRLGEIIRSRREALGIPQAKLAEIAGVTRPSMSNIEAGRQDFCVSRLQPIAAALRLRTGDLP